MGETLPRTCGMHVTWVTPDDTPTTPTLTAPLPPIRWAPAPLLPGRIRGHPNASPLQTTMSLRTLLALSHFGRYHSSSALGYLAYAISLWHEWREKGFGHRSEERRVGKGGRSRWSADP